MMTDIEIAQSCQMQPITVIAEKAGIQQDELELYGRYKAKIAPAAMARLQDKPDGKLVLVTAINPTPAGEGKTTTTVGLGQAMARIGQNAVIALREPSLGPVFGVKGGAAGGGWAQVVPMEDINLHFTGDMHAITAANNLLCAIDMTGEQLWNWMNTTVNYYDLDENGNVYEIVHAPFTSPSFDENAPEATVEITLGTNDANGAQLIYTMGEGTVGYYQSVYTQLDYDELVAYGLSIDMTEEEYIQQYTAFYGYAMFENDDFVWPLDPDTEYVAVGCPFNKNGIEGYGKMATLKFKTAPEAEEGAAVREFVTKRNTVKRALVRKEQLDALKK